MIEYKKISYSYVYIPFSMNSKSLHNQRSQPTFIECGQFGLFICLIACHVLQTDAIVANMSNIHAHSSVDDFFMLSSTCSLSTSISLCGSLAPGGVLELVLTAQRDIH